MALSDHDYERILICASEAGISDIHFHVGEPVFWRRYGILSPLKEYVPSTEDLWRIFTKIATDEQREKYVDGNDVDFSWNLEQWRFRINAYRQKGKLSLAFRSINRIIPVLEDLGEAGRLSQFINKRQGLIMVTGATSMGKTTTMSAFINQLNLHNDLHIVTLEDPIEYVYPRGRSIISQRELGQDFYSYTSALKSVLRQDPDVICVSELRSYEVAQLAINAAATGHLVLTTMHTANTTEALQRLETMFPAEQQTQARNLISSVLVGIMSQQLLPCSRGGMQSAVEILVANQAVKNLIRTGKYEQIMTVIQSGSKLGMQTMDMSINNLRHQNLIKDDEESMDDMATE